MAYSPTGKYPGATEVDPNYKNGKFKDNNPSTTNNGSPLKAIDRNELLARDEAIMNDAGFDYNEQPDTPQNSQLFEAYKASLGNGANLLSNHNFLIQTPDDSQPLPDATPRSYPPGYQIFSGVFANETIGITNLTYIDGRVSFSGGDLYFPVPNSGGLEQLTEFAASVADFEGKPRTRGVSYALVGDEYRVTVGIDALEDVSATLTPLGSVKFEQGGAATGHFVGASAKQQAHAGDSQLAGGNIWPVDSDFVSIGPGIDYSSYGGQEFVRVNDGSDVSEVKWIGKAIDEIDLSSMTIQSITEYKITFSDGFESPLLPPVVKHTGIVTPVMFGADPKGVIYPNAATFLINPSAQPIVNTASDSTQAIQQMIEYCAPYEWAGSIGLTKDALGNIRASASGSGNFRTTSPIMINPFFMWRGERKAGFFGVSRGTNVLADFTDKLNYVADTAPMIAGGSRPLGATYNRTNWDDGDIAGGLGFDISDVNFAPLQGNTVKGAFNRQSGQQSKLIDCGFGGFGGICYEGIKNAVCWGGELSGNHIIASAYPIRNDADVTTDYQHNNYCTVSSTGKPDPSDYTYITWPNATLQDKSACIVCRFADPHLDSNTCEGGEIGIQATGGNYLRETNSYFERISDYIYAGHTINLDVSPKFLIAPSADLISIDGSSIDRARINLQACSYFDVNGWGSISSFTGGVSLYGSQIAANLPYHSRVTYEDIVKNGVLEIYVDNTGDDVNTGYRGSAKVQTIQGALERCLPEVLCKIIPTAGQTISTKYSLLDGNVSNRFIDNLNIVFDGDSTTVAVGESFNQTHSMSLSKSKIFFKDTTIDLSSAAAEVFDYGSFFRSINECDYSTFNCTILGSGRALIGAQNDKPGTCRLTMDNTTLGSGLLLTTDSGVPKSFSWIETSMQITNDGVTEGTASTGKIFSSLF